MSGLEYSPRYLERKGANVNALTVIVLLVVAVAIYKIASDRGKRNVARKVAERDEALDREEIENDRENWDHTNAGDNLNDAISGKRTGKR